MGGCHGELRAITGGRVQKVISRVELYVRREADKLVVLRAGHRVDVGELDDIRLFGFEGEAERHQAAEPTLDPRRGESVAAAVGDRRIIGELGGCEEILVDSEKVRPPEIRSECVDLLADLGRKPQIFGIAEQVAVLPEGPGTEALAGVVGQPGPNRAMRSLGRIDFHLHVPGIVGIRHRGDLHRAEQSAFDQRSACLFDLVRVVDFALLPTDAPLDISGIQPLEPFDPNRAEAHDWSGIKGVGHCHRVGVFVDLDPPVVYLRKGVAAFAKSRQ
jgi:hypothetical protein